MFWLDFRLIVEKLWYWTSPFPCPATPSNISFFSFDEPQLKLLSIFENYAR